MTDDFVSANYDEALRLYEQVPVRTFRNCNGRSAYSSSEWGLLLVQSTEPQKGES
jgi:hypothetical protein